MFFNAASLILKYRNLIAIFNCFYSRKNLPKRMDGRYIIDLDEYKSIEQLLESFVCEW